MNINELNFAREFKMYLIMNDDIELIYIIIYKQICQLNYTYILNRYFYMHVLISQQKLIQLLALYQKKLHISSYI